MGETQRVWLDVPFVEKDKAKALGARWDRVQRRWYDPHPGSTSGLKRWAARPPVPVLLPGEDRSFGSGLFVDPVPSSCWFTNVRSCVEPADWERLRRMILGRAGQRCEACGREEDRPARRWLEGHERWAYDELAGVQALRRLICLCTDCHRSTHYGLARVQGREVEAFEHLRAVTGMAPDEARAHVAEAAAVWQHRSARSWTLDLSALTGTGITVEEPPAAQDRPGAAEDALRTGSRAAFVPPEQPRPAPPAGHLIVDVAGVDLARNRPGQAAGAVADDYRAATPVWSRVAPLLGMRTAEAPWRAGAAGEAITAGTLRRLSDPVAVRWLGRDPSWFVLHAIPVGDRGTDIDHLLLGPAGVFTINTKHHPGKTVWVGDHAITVNRAPTRYAEKARSEADRASRPAGRRESRHRGAGDPGHRHGRCPRDRSRCPARGDRGGGRPAARVAASPASSSLRRRGGAAARDRPSLHDLAAQLSAVAPVIPR